MVIANAEHDFIKVISPMSKTKASRRDPAGGSYRGLDRSIHILFVARIIDRFGDFVQMLLVLILTLRTV